MLSDILQIFDRSIEDDFDPLDEWDYHTTSHLESPHPHFCVQHGGSESCERHNEIHGFTCPRCQEEMDWEYSMAVTRSVAAVRDDAVGVWNYGTWSLDPPSKSAEETVNWKKEGF